MGNLCTNCIDVTNMGKGNCDPTKASNVVYTGPNLPCSGVNTNDNLNTVLSKIEENLCSAPGGQNLQTTLEIGNIAEDIGAKFTSLVNPTLYTEILSTYIVSPAFIKIGGLSTQYLMADGSVSDGTSSITQVIADGDTTHAPSADAVYDALLLKADDDNVIHKTLDETKTGQLIVTPVDTSISAIIGNSVDNAGVRGNSDNSPGVFGVSTNNFGVVGQGPGGVKGSSPLGTGVSGQSTDGIGVEGLSSIGAAVKGSSTTGIGIVANSVLGFKLASFQANSTEMAYVNALGDYTGNKFVKTGGTALQYLMADGSVTTALIASQIAATPHVDYLTGATVQLQLDQTETTVVGLFKNDKVNFKDIYQTGRVRVDTDVSVLSISPANTLNITACDNILFVNEILIDTPANKIANFLLSFGNKSFVANATNTLLAANTRGVFYVGLDKLGTPVYRTSKVYDQDVCYMARIVVENTAGVYTIVLSKYFPDLANNRVNNRDRLVLSSGYIVPSGAASISFGNRGVTYSKNSINYSNNKFDPNYLALADSINPVPMSFLFFLPNITSLAVSLATSTVINPTQWYNAAGTVGAGAVGNTNYQVYKLFVTVTGTLAIQTKASTSNTTQPGVNAIFANRDDALAGLTSTVFPDILPAGDSIALGTFYLRAGTNVNGSELSDPNDFYFRPFTSTSSSSNVGVTAHDLLSGKNDNPTYQHVTTADISNWNAKQNALTNPVTGTGTVGQVSFWSGTGTQTGDSAFIWDNVNKRVGFSKATPTAKLDIGGSINIDSNLLDTSVRPSYTGTLVGGEIRGYLSNFPTSDGGLLRLSAGGGTAGNQKSYIDLTGASTITDMDRNIVMGVNGIEQFRLATGGNFGLGTAPSISKVEIGIAGNIPLSLKTLTPNSAVILQYKNSIGSQRGYIGFGTISSSNMTISNLETGGHITLETTSTGNIAIGGNPNPFTKLNLVGTMSIDSNLTASSTRPIISAGYLSNGEIRGYNIANGADSGFLRLSAGGNTLPAQRSFIDLTGNSSVTDMDRNIVFGTGGIEQIRLDKNGNVGIGTSVPIGKLNINTGSLPTTDIVTQANGTISFCNTTATTNFVPTIAGKSSNGIGLELLSASWDLNPNPDMLFDVRESDNTDFTTLTTPAFKFSRFGVSLVDILRNGNIGFGIIAPTAKVHIAASTTLAAAMRLTVGVAPTTPNDGDIWLESNTNTGLKIRIAGVTKTVSLV